MTEYAFEGATQNSTVINWSFANANYTFDASTPFSRTIGALYQSTIVAAFARWASVSGLTFNQVSDSASVAIRVGFGAFSATNELGETDYRYSNGLFTPDTLIRLLDPVVTPLVLGSNGYAYTPYGVTLYQVALHEIGHSLGLDHTTDPGTIMYPYASPLDTDLAAGDVYGINTLYPVFDVAAANPIQVEGGTGQVDTYNFTITRHSDPSTALVVNYTVSGVADPAVTGSQPASAAAFVNGFYPSGLVVFAAGSTTATLSISVAGNATPQPDLGFQFSLSTGGPANLVTIHGSTVAAILDDDGYGQVSGGTLGVYRFFDKADGTHFFSTSQNERNTLIETRPDLVYEGVSLTAVAAPASDPAAVPVFRFFDSTNGTHFYTASPSEQASIAASRPDLVAEGTAFYEHGTAQPGDAPVYRFFEKTDGTHFYSASTSERNAIQATRSDLVYEGVAFYAPTS